jgi:hypothetical protein
LKGELGLKNSKDQLPEAISRMFPTIESYAVFKRNNTIIFDKVSQKLITLAYEYKHIPDKTEHELIKLVKSMSMSRITSFHEKVSFAETMDHIAHETSINNIIEWLNRVATDLDLPKIQASMITRMKQNGHFKTSRQQLTLRLIAFWVGLKRPHLPYTYHTFMESFDIAPTSIPVTEDEGVRVDFTFFQHSEVIDFQMVEWLKNELLQCIKDLNLFSITGNRLTFHSTTTASLKIHKASGPSLEPRLYAQAVRSAIALAHQIVVRWDISPVNRRQSGMVVGIAAGKFSMLSAQLQTLVEAAISENPVIRMTEYAKLCACLTDAKVVFHPEPKAYAMANGDILTIWAIKYFWFLYYDFIPRLLDCDMLPTNDMAYEDFKNLINFPGIYDLSSGNKILSAIRQFPQNDILIIQTAKVCLSRRMFAEANNILSTIFASNPFNHVARSLRMLIFLNMAMDQQDYTLFELYFDRAKKEGDFVMKYCQEEEEMWCEYGLLYWTRAIFILKQLRKKIITDKNRRGYFKAMIMSDLKQAETCFQNGMIISPTLNRPGFWIIHLQSLYEMIKLDPSILESTTAIRDSAGVYGFVSVNFFISHGWMDAKVLTITDQNERINHLNQLINRMTQAIHTYNDSAHLKMYKPNVAFSIATVLWDFCPMITVGIAKSVLEWLEKSRNYARQLVDKNIGVFSIVAWNSQIQEPAHFVNCVTRAIDAIHGIVGDNFHQDNQCLIDNSSLNGFKLFPMFFDEPINPGVLF